MGDDYTRRTGHPPQDVKLTVTLTEVLPMAARLATSGGGLGSVGSPNKSFIGRSRSRHDPFDNGIKNSLELNCIYERSAIFQCENGRSYEWSDHLHGRLLGPVWHRRSFRS